MLSTTSPLNDSSYVLKRDHLASSRLNLQFFLWKNSLQFNLHPTIPKPVAGKRVADIGTGTAIWLLDTARDSSKEVEFVGFDISLTQAPHASFLPSNVKLRQWDFFEDPPADAVGAFDIVHVRLIMLILKDNNALQVILNLCKLLKPGGYLQWDEVDASGMYIEKIDDSIEAPTMKMLFSSFAIPKETKTEEGWKDNLLLTLDTHGFCHSKAYHYRDDASMARYWNDVYMVAWDEFISKIMGHTEKTQGAIEMAKAEAQSGAAVMMPKTIWVARRAMHEQNKDECEANGFDLSPISSKVGSERQSQLCDSTTVKRTGVRKWLQLLNCRN